MLTFVAQNDNLGSDGKNIPIFNTRHTDGRMNAGTTIYSFVEEKLFLSQGQDNVNCVAN